MIKPTIGRDVLFWPARYHSGIVKGGQPFAAKIAYVHSDTTVSLGYFDSNGVNFNAANVRLWQGDDDRPLNGFCEYPPGPSVTFDAAGNVRVSK
jgi:hypothetical protein